MKYTFILTHGNGSYIGPFSIEINDDLISEMSPQQRDEFLESEIYEDICNLSIQGVESLDKGVEVQRIPS